MQYNPSGNKTLHNQADRLNFWGMSGALVHNLILFGRILHALGLDINPGRMVDLVEALNYVEVGQKADFYYTLRGLLVHGQTEIPLFDQAFDLFWRRHDAGVELSLGDLLRQTRPPRTLLIPPPLRQEDTPHAQKTGDDAAEPQTIIEITHTYSAREALRRKDFGAMTADEIAAVRQMLAEFVWQLGARRTRRLHNRPGPRPDLRRSLRRNLRYGGELIEWRTRQRKIKPRPLILIADISGSMERYTRLLLHFLYSLAEGLEQRVEVFVFSTRLTRITRPLRQHTPDEAITEVARAVPDWSGGTRIGEALKRFNFEWGRRVLRGGAVVLLISDGWDRGDPALLGREMARLQRTCRRLIWLNPLLGSAQYEPLTRGMQAALPFVDDFLPVHNLASLEGLAGHLAHLDARSSRPVKLSGAAFIGR